MENDTHRVSVLVTVFNRETYVRECLESILRSSFDDFEVIVVDDASTDQSVDLIEQFVKSDSRIRLHRNPENLGDYANRNQAASKATGKYLKYVDADDVIYSHSLALMVEAMEKNQDAALGLCHSATDETAPYPLLLEPKKVYEKHFVNRGCLSCGPSGAILRRDAFEEAGGFDTGRGTLGDLDLWFRLAAKHPVLLLPPGLVWWRRHDGQEFTADGAADFYLEQGFRLSMESLNSPDCPLDGRRQREALRKHRQHHARRLLALGVKGRRPSTAVKLFRSSGLGIFELLGGLRRYR